MDTITVIPSPPAALMQRTASPPLFEFIQQIAPVVYQSRLFKVGSAEQAAMIMLKGHELGLSLTASFEFIQVVEGVPTLSPRGMLALLHQSKLFDMEIKDEPGRCTVTMKRRDTGFHYTSVFTMEDAARAGLLRDRSAWVTYPANMLRWRAIGYCADVVAPDVLAGMKRADELGARIDREGNVVEAEVQGG